ncbi:Dyp-type peroxidase [Streptomyces sp. ISL-99]|uniref:Dyp-type peroxidase n=1 Tax=Streptomyces sp. ISL-99 TaxID=2819193 RepID=UPI0027E45F52|nr:Dyp-type peroxidase [Streptomyces sp. ISL-99]
MIALDQASVADASPGGIQHALRELLHALDAARLSGAKAGPALGAALFARHGRNERRPRGLTEMPAFPGDLLDPARSHGDVLVQIAADRRTVVGSAVDQLLKATPAWNLRWRADGFRPDNHDANGQGLTRNPFHFTEGFGNPNSGRATYDRALVQVSDDEPDWAIGGSYQVVRVIRLATELWDKDPVHEQERIIGRRRGGRWLDGTPPSEEPNFRSDPRGLITPLDSHVRLAAPDRRNPPQMVRRSYSYDGGDGDAGLLFSCFQRNVVQGFEAVQKRLADESMAKYLLTVGGGYFFVPPPTSPWMGAAFDDA